MTSLTDDIRLMTEMRDGSKTAFNRLFRRYHPKLLAYATLFVDGQEAENVVQDVMLSIWERRQTLTLRHSLCTYLHSAVRNRCLTITARGLVEGKALSAMKLTLIDESIAPPCPYTVKELNINLQKAIYDLPDHLRSTFELSRIEGKKYISK